MYATLTSDLIREEMLVWLEMLAAAYKAMNNAGMKGKEDGKKEIQK